MCASFQRVIARVYFSYILSINIQPCKNAEREKHHFSGVIEVARKRANKQYHTNTKAYYSLFTSLFLEYEDPICDLRRVFGDPVQLSLVPV